MAGAPRCKACGYVIEQEPPKAIDDPDGPGPSNPDAHLWINHGAKGPRFHCEEMGQMTSIVAGDDDETILTPNEYYEKLGIDMGDDEEDGGTPDHRSSASDKEPNTGSTAPSTQSKRPERGLDLREDLEPIDLLEDVLDDPIYELSEPQIAEVVSWAEEFDDGMIPPDSLEELLGLLEGVSKQKAQLMRQKYELKIQRWMRQRSEPDSGPPIGVMGRRRSPSTSGINISRSTGSSASRSGMSTSSTPDIEETDDEPQRVIDRRRQKAQERVDEFADEFLSSFASNVGDDAGRFYSDIRGIVITALRKKAERDPDWVIEKLETFGGFELLDELMEPSDTKKREDAVRESQMNVDAEVDQAAASIIEDSQQTQQTTQQRQQPQQRTEQPQRQQNQQQREQTTPQNTGEEYYEEESEQNPMESLIDEEGEGDTEAPQTDGEEEMFEETFGQLTE